MPKWNLADNPNQLKPLSTFIVLAVMCHPSDRIKRERMIGRVVAATGATARRKPLDEDGFFGEVRAIAPKAGLAGSLLLSLLQLDHYGQAASLNTAIAVTQPWLPKWHQPTGPDWKPDSGVGHIPTNRRRMLRAFDEFLPVAHLWAALLHAQQQQRPELFPDRNENLPGFLGVAQTVADLASSLPRLPPKCGRLLPRQKLWSFSIPPILAVKPDLLPHPPSREQVAAFNDLSADKVLK